jgi:hypothetical protein
LLHQLNLVIRFWPGKLSATPDFLTCCWDVYPKEGDKDYARVNPHNFRPVFATEQLTSSLRASDLAIPVLHASVLMDIEQLHIDILAALPDDPVAHKHLPDPSDLIWLTDDSGFLRCNNHIYVPESNNLCLRILCKTHDHPQ